MKYTDDYADNKEDQQYIDSERLRQIAERNKWLHGDTAVGEEADRIINNMLFSWEDQLDKRVSCRSVALKIGTIVKPLADTVPLAKDVQIVQLEGSACLYYCTTDSLLQHGTKVTVDSAFHAKPLSTILHFDVNTDIFYEGFDDNNSNEHPSTVVTTDTTCSYCQQTGLHWSGKKGVNLCLRDSNGFKHDCGRSKVTINL